MTVGVEKRRKRVLIEPITVTEEPASRRLTTLRARISERWGPIAPHAIATVALYILFAVLARLILLSILIGVILSALGLDPLNILNSVERLIRSVWNMGFDAVLWMWRYFLLGAVIVIPIWLIMRLINAPRGR